MSTIDVRKDPEALTMTITADLEATAERAWQLWADPRQLERWWGPPGYPATFVEHDLSPDFFVTYFMTSPEGQRHHGWWRVKEVEPPHRLRVEDGFGDADGKPDDSLPTATMTVTLSEADGRTSMEIESHFPSTEAMEKVLEMGMEEGMIQALGQIDALLAEGS